MTDTKRAREVLAFFEDEALSVAELVLGLAKDTVIARQKAGRPRSAANAPHDAGAIPKRRGRPPKKQQAPPPSGGDPGPDEE